MRTVSLLLCLAVVFGSLQDWGIEVLQSMEDNLIKCSWKGIGSNSTDKIVFQGSKILESPTSKQICKSGQLAVAVLIPSQKEIDRFRSLPSTLTTANTRLPEMASKRGYNHEKWVKAGETSWTIPKDHPGQNRPMCLEKVSKASTGEVSAFYDEYKRIDRISYVIRGLDAYIHPTGVVGFACGYFRGSEGCETRWDPGAQWWAKCNEGLTRHNLTWKALWSTTSTPAEVYDACVDDAQQMRDHKLSTVPAMYDRVFVVDALWDYNFHHLMADSLARIVTSLKFLRHYSNIKIHIRHYETDLKGPVRPLRLNQKAEMMRNSLFTLLGIDPTRLVHGPVLAKVVYIPRNTRCSYALSNPIEMRLLGKELVNAATALALKAAPVGEVSPPLLTLSSPRTIREASQNISYFYTMAREATTKKVKYNERAAGTRPTMIVLQRKALIESTDRDWDARTLQQVITSFGSTFSSHDIVTVRSSNTDLPEYCRECEILEYRHADVLVGAHGAGLTSMLYMPPGSLIVEIVGDFKDVNMPVCGYYGPLAAVMGHHHYLYAFHFQGREKINATIPAAEAHKFYLYLQSLRTSHNV